MGVVNFVASGGPANATRIFLLRAHGRDDAKISGLPAFGNGGAIDEIDGVSSLDGPISLCKSSDFVSVGGLPEVAVAALAKFAIFLDFASVWIDSMSVIREMER